MSRVADYISFNEGYRQHMYKDTEGIWTIGIGFNLEEGFTVEECELILNHRIGKIRKKLWDRVPEYRQLCPVRKIVLEDMAYNLGVGGLMNFKKMLAAIKEEDWEKASDELLDSKYATQVGPRADRNAYMIRSGQWYT